MTIKLCHGDRVLFHIQTDMVVASEDVRSKGEKVYGAAVEFLADTMSPERRVVMVSAARELLLAVTRLLVIVDMIDVNKILTLSSRVRGSCFFTVRA